MAMEIRIRALMDARGWTQIEVAQHLGVTQSWISRLLNGRSRRLDTFARVAQRLDELEREAIAS